MNSQLVYVDGAGEIRVRDVASGADSLLAGTWMMEEGESDKEVRYRWPTWSPERDHIAFEGVTVGPAGVERSILWRATVDGLRAEAVEELPPGRLVYLRWDSDRSGLWTLTEGEEGLRLARAGNGAAVAEGAPLFLSTLPGSGVAAHVFAGDRRRGRLCLLEPGREAEVLSGAPGSFRAPVVLADGTVCFTVRDEAGSRLARWSRAEGPDLLPIRLAGRVVLASGSHGSLLVASGAAEAREFERLDRVEAEGRALERLLDRPFSSVFPLADHRLAFVTAESSGAFTWHVREPEGEMREIFSFVPTDEEALRLGFFDQYQHSHSPVDPDGRGLVVAGVDVGAEGLPDEPQLYLVPLDGEARPRAIGPGSFGAWPPLRSR